MAGGRPSTRLQIDEVCARAGVRPESVKNFFARPGRLSPQTRQDIAAAVAATGYRPARTPSGALAGIAVGYQVPRAFDAAPPPLPMVKQLLGLVSAVQQAGGQLVPFTIDPRVAGVDDVIAGTTEERVDPRLSLRAWHRDYARALARPTYHDMMKHKGIQAFFVNDLLVDDERLNLLRDEGVPYVALGAPRDTTAPAGVAPHPSIETDNRRAIGEMVRRLRAAGCETFAHINFADDDGNVPLARRENVDEALGGKADRIMVPFALDKGNHPDQLARIEDFLRKHDPDAVICDSDDLAALARTAGINVGRSVIQNPDGLRATEHRTLMITGNDNSARRAGVPRDERWMTLEGDGPTKLSKAVDLLGRVRAGVDTGDTTVLVPPLIVGAPGHGPDDVIELS